MTSLAIAVLGATAGFTIFLGLPLGRLRTVSIEVRASLNAVATGVLVFLLWDVLAHASDPVEAALTATTVHGSWWRFGGLVAVVAAGVTVGLMALVYYERWISRPRTAVHERVPGPGAATSPSSLINTSTE